MAKAIAKSKFDLDAYKKKLMSPDYKPDYREDAFIYKITNINNGKIYIGRTVRKPEKRWQEHCSLVSKSSGRSLISEAIHREEKESFEFEIIEIVDARVVDYVESAYITHYDCMAPKGYNCVKLDPIRTFSECTLDKISKTSKGRKAWNKGTKGLQKAWNKGISNVHAKKPIVAIHKDTGKVTHFDSAVQAHREAQFNPDHIAQCCKERKTPHKAHYFKYLSDYKPDQGGHIG